MISGVLSSFIRKNRKFPIYTHTYDNIDKLNWEDRSQSSQNREKLSKFSLCLSLEKKSENSLAYLEKKNLKLYIIIKIKLKNII